MVSEVSDRSFSVVVPIHNEAAFLPSALERLVPGLEDVGASWELILVENGSTDDTLDVARRHEAEREEITVLTLPEADYGAAIRAGFKRASGSWVVSFDVDYFSLAFLKRSLELSQEADVVIASKQAPGSNDTRSAVRRIGTRVFHGLVKALVGTNVSDTHGMKAVSKATIDRWADEVVCNKDLFDTEFVLRAERGGCRIVEEPVVVQELRPSRQSLLRRIPRTLRGLLRLRRVLRGS